MRRKKVEKGAVGKRDNLFSQIFYPLTIIFLWLLGHLDRFITCLDDLEKPTTNFYVREGAIVPVARERFFSSAPYTPPFLDLTTFEGKIAETPKSYQRLALCNGVSSRASCFEDSYNFVFSWPFVHFFDFVQSHNTVSLTFCASVLARVRISYVTQRSISSQ